MDPEVATRESAAPAAPGTFEAEADVVVVGGGGGGLPTALFSSASAQAYWAGGATLGPIIALAYRAARAAHGEPVRAEAMAAAADGRSS